MKATGTFRLAVLLIALAAVVALAKKAPLQELQPVVRTNDYESGLTTTMTQLKIPGIRNTASSPRQSSSIAADSHQQRQQQQQQQRSLGETYSSGGGGGGSGSSLWILEDPSTWDAAEVATFIFVAFLIFILLCFSICCCCKCRFSLWDVFAIFCCWEICCDDGRMLSGACDGAGALDSALV